MTMASARDDLPEGARADLPRRDSRLQRIGSRRRSDEIGLAKANHRRDAELTVRIPQ